MSEPGRKKKAVLMLIVLLLFAAIVLLLRYALLSSRKDAQDLPPLSSYATEDVAYANDTLRGCTKKQLKKAYGKPVTSTDGMVDTWKIPKTDESISIVYNSLGKVKNVVLSRSRESADAVF